MKYLSIMFVLVFLSGNIIGISKKYTHKNFIDPYEMGECEKNTTENEKETEKNVENLFGLHEKKLTFPIDNCFEWVYKKFWDIPKIYLTKEIIFSIFNPPEYLS